MKTVWTQAARSDLRDISRYIGSDNPQRAVSFVDEIVSAGESILDMPLGFPLAHRLEHLAIRRRVHGSYLILYRVLPEAVEILHVVHTARDMSAS
ncbi:type II toxin-antitoxin system RelE/ParE family toxin [Sphingomonas immobilis]|uniref:Type II toxin-antitoxin system RelE/ParE family toxin n=1 Tax=Sphingomonas immobilis TaxID=3063997 RepID=A0ABT8ZTI4_9SPHN|nr:type II toxin-antitoxin system RelE/ParE family toxin [Sphingomonas sp. CA1-15]MDO7840871.1 type II toxin-antitoxin system RelE/ParE family toxin [Sphingomonas sp. CA1-15]